MPRGAMIECGRTDKAKILKILIIERKAAVVPKNTIRRLISIVNYSILKGDNKNKADSNGRAAS